MFAGPVGAMAQALEKASAGGDFAYVREHNPAFLEVVGKLLGDLDDLLVAFDNENPKPKKLKPDNEALLKLLRACRQFDMDGVDEAMEEIEHYRYESDDGLAAWLREAVDMMELSQIAEKLSDLE
jgi:hypothetical protein